MTGTDTLPARPGRRRALWVLGGAAMVGIGGSALLRHAYRPAVTGRLLTPPEALAMTQAGAVLVDIRRPDEWARTGIGAGAVPIDMRRDDFLPALEAALGGDRSRPVILICAAGVRSRILAGRLETAGFRTILDVPEGMLGSRAGPGWLRRGLPVTAHNGE